jgi:hypothetical protein
VRKRREDRFAIGNCLFQRQVFSFVSSVSRLR